MAKLEAKENIGKSPKLKNLKPEAKKTPKEKLKNAVLNTPESLVQKTTPKESAQKLSKSAKRRLSKQRKLSEGSNASVNGTTPKKQVRWIQRILNVLTDVLVNNRFFALSKFINRLLLSYFNLLIGI